MGEANPYVRLRLNLGDNRINFQVTVQDMANSEEATLRLARGAMVLFENGSSRDEVFELKQRCVEKARQLAKSGLILELLTDAAIESRTSGKAAKTATGIDVLDAVPSKSKAL